MQAWLVVSVAILYLLVLFAVARFGDTYQQTDGLRSRATIYPLSLAIYCTSWTFFGSVGLAASSGLNFLAIYIGPILMITVGFGLFKKVASLSKRESITSVADFLGARYGKSVKVAAVATIIAVVGTIPYIALQLKAVSSSLDTLISPQGFQLSNTLSFLGPVLGDVSFLIAICLAAFTILFGTRHSDATEHQFGLMLAVALESFIKLAAFLSVGLFVTFFMFDGVGDLINQASTNANILAIVERDIDFVNVAVLTLLSFVVFLLLPRQFHVAIVENQTEEELTRARWLFPLYLVLINLFVIPIAAAGLITFGTNVSADNFVLALPQTVDNNIISIFAFIGGLSAGTAMVIVACVSLAIMISNHLIIPAYLSSNASQLTDAQSVNMEQRILKIRRWAISGVLMLAFAYYKLADNTQALASIGLVSFAAIAQLAPAFFGGLFWRRANARGAMTGMVIGFVFWAQTLLLPTMGVELFTFSFLPTYLTSLDYLGFNNFSTGVILSLFFNTLGYIVTSFLFKNSPLEGHQATLFVGYKKEKLIAQNYDGDVTVTVAQIRELLVRYLGDTRTERAFTRYWHETGNVLRETELADRKLIQFSEQLLASAIGSSSSRLVHSLLLQRFGSTSTANLTLLDEATEAIQYNRDVLQTAFDQLEQGITVFDSNYKLSFWNKRFRVLLDLPISVGQAGTPLSEIAKTIAVQHRKSDADHSFDGLQENLLRPNTAWGLALPKLERILEIRSSPMPGGGIVIAWNNVTERMLVSEALREANETLEKRVEERTSDLVFANKELEIATRSADLANASKTKFLSAAGHDLLQPLNAARLYASTLVEQNTDGKNDILAGNISKSLDSVEELLGSILAISRLDSVDPKMNIGIFPIQKIFDQIDIEFRPMAEEKNLELIILQSSLWVKSDPAYLRRLLQNLVSNSIKYTPDGRILVGCKRTKSQVFVEVMDTGLGIGDKDQDTVFSEFTRLDSGIQQAPGLGLGLSIVDRISKILDHPVTLNSTVNMGTHFRVTLPRSKAVISTQKTEARKKERYTNSLSGLRVLCIDNDLSILDGMRTLLEQWNCDVIIVTDANAAIKEMRNKRYAPEIALVDYHLDSQNGLQAINQFRDAGYSRLQSILVTADRSPEVQKEAETVGVSILNKPIKPAQLRAVLSQARTQLSAAE
ncbi:MAG: PAS-domain containing protein [Rhizobiales bacterium]|nr:PAS-domain containing protein [Hyphomicrobiales bacterium]